MAPIDFNDLERRGVLRKVANKKGWYLVLKSAALPAYETQQATRAGQTRVDGRWVPMLKFSTAMNRRAAALRARIKRPKAS